jgi:hypothetical protein
MRAASEAKRADCSAKLLELSPIAKSKTYCLSENEYAQVNHLQDKMFHQRQTMSTDVPIAPNAQDAAKKASQADQSPHAPILMNSTSLN